VQANVLAAASLLVAVSLVYQWVRSYWPPFTIIFAKQGRVEVFFSGSPGNSTGNYGLRNDWRWSTLGFSYRPYPQLGLVELGIPFYFLVVLFGLPALTYLATVWRRNSRIEQHRCATCGYDMRATPDRCPECGTAVGPAA
jgi:hypothetical protein